MTHDIPESAEETLTVREMAARSGFSEHTLRYYERIGLIAPIPRDDSSGHRRYSPEVVSLVEGLACLRGIGLSLDELRTYLKLRERGKAAAAEQKALFTARADAVEREIETMQARLEYLRGKAAYWEAQERGDETAAREIRETLHELAKRLGMRKSV